jgi:hypothetical protein
MLSEILSELSTYLLSCEVGLTGPERSHALEVAAQAQRSPTVRCVEHHSQPAIGDTSLCYSCVVREISNAPRKR